MTHLHSLFEIFLSLQNVLVYIGSSFILSKIYQLILACCHQVELSEDDRKKVILATLSQFPNTSMDKKTRKWATFYRDTLAKSPLRSILEKISYIVTKKYQNPASKFGSLDLENNTLIELEEYKQISNIVPLKNINATIGLSPSWKLLDALDNPIFASVKGSLKTCLNTGSCKKVKLIRNSIKKDDYTLAQTSDNFPILLR